MGNDGDRLTLRCPRCAHAWTTDCIADDSGRYPKGQEVKAVVAKIPLPGRPGEIATCPYGNHVYVTVDDSIAVISRFHHIVATYRTGPHPKDILVSANGTHVYVTGYDGSISSISVADNTVNTVVRQRSTAEVIGPDGDRVYLLHRGMSGDTDGSRISVVGAGGENLAVVPVDKHAVGIGISPDGHRLYVASRLSSSWLDWRGFIAVIDTGSYKLVARIAMEVAVDSVAVSRDGDRLYATSYHKNAVSVIDLNTRAETRWQVRDAPIDIAVSPDGGLAYVTNLQSVTALNVRTRGFKKLFVGGLPRAVRLSPDGRRAYVLDAATRTIRALDTSDNSVIGTVDIGGRPESMSLGGDGAFLYVTDYLDNTLTVISAALLHGYGQGA
jgi:YVTN family beta-propeller protein